MTIIEWIKQPWPWYISGPLIGLTAPLLLLLGNKSFGISSNLRHVCAACFPSGIHYFQYNWKKEIWNLLFATGVTLGAFIAVNWLNNGDVIQLNSKLVNELQQYHINTNEQLTPADIFSWNSLFTQRGFVFIVIGGFLVGFGTRYAGGCTSGHSIMGMSNLQWPSLVATICFMAGGFFMSNIIIPFILK